MFIYSGLSVFDIIPCITITDNHRIMRFVTLIYSKIGFIKDAFFYVVIFNHILPISVCQSRIIQRNLQFGIIELIWHGILDRITR